MAIFTRPKAQGGRDIVGCKVTATYNDKPIEGMVVSQRKIEGKGNLLTIETANGFKSVYFEKAVDVMFYAPRETVHYSDDGYDAMRDRRLERYGVR